MFMRTIDPKTVAEKYDEISRLETRSERIELLNKQSEEMMCWIIRPSQTYSNESERILDLKIKHDLEQPKLEILQKVQL